MIAEVANQRLGAMARGGNGTVVMGLLGIIGMGMSFPYFVRSRQGDTTTVGKTGQLTGSQRQRGMYMNGGSSDAGPDVDYDAATGKWHGYEKRAAQRAAAIERKRQRPEGL